MTKLLKEFIKECTPQTKGTFDQLMFVSNGSYDGFFGKNHYDNIMILGHIYSSNEWKIVSNYGDCFILYNKSGCTLNLDINSKLKIPRIWFDGAKIVINNEFNISTIRGEVVAL